MTHSTTPDLDIESVRDWLSDTASLEELLDLRDTLAHAISLRRQENLTAIRRQIEIIAHNAGFSSVSELSETLLRQSPDPARPDQQQALTEIRQLKGSRKPFMNPFDPQSACYALSERADKRPHWPQWAQDLVQQGWSKDEFHYKRINSSLRVRGISPTYDPEKRYKLLTAVR